ncbi:conserved hypothetical protein [Talaromyces stipitatus ATCC 10500]|uniref:Heme haloperoxidase family profile domain-containing protein n=1 Tax=Talaromyces stipitatus (strain ATCC 10500 / CBS 375.48 / QM 6759 / NRRL 1006) TaxID=441959 RepID=B8MRF3_TALSN|nr:uncharacterized protein TSTA_055900 [Talaromyces stipitatus ATCC 10500]EED13090.1 conserved hypothetical protein [Talaromyces stipitatus ATCC 10500]
MKLTLFFEICLLSLAAYGLQFPSEGHEWHPPVPGDSRSPCPGLNVMANHGFLPRSGKNIDLAAVRSGVSQAYNYAPTSFDTAFEQAVAFNLTTTGNISTFNLEDLKKHDDVEFDGSLSRNDAFFGDDNTFNHAIWWTTAHRLGLYDYGISEKDKYVTVETAARARAARVRDAMRINPVFNASANEMTGSPGTTALYLTTLWDDEAGGAPKEWVRAFFENERIPYLEGYQPPIVPKTSDDINAMFARVTAVNVSDIIA